MDLDERLQSCFKEIQLLKDENVSLSKDNKELRDLCCFLDDDRQKSKRLAREWQKFGKHTAKIMRQELDNYRHKLKILDSRQHELMKDNYELKDLCIYLDEERNLIDEMTCPHCSNIVVPPSQRGINSISQRLASLRPSMSRSITEHQDSKENNKLFEQLSEDDACGDSISSSNETNTSMEETCPRTQILEPDFLTQADSIQTQNYIKEIDQKLLNLPKVQEVISIYEQKDELADQQDNLKAILEEMCSVVLKSMESSNESKFCQTNF